MFTFGMFEIIFIIAVVVMIRNVFRFSSFQGEVFRQFKAHQDATTQPSAREDNQPSFEGCPKCGASLDADTEISPSGDYKCPYCNSWSNVNQ